MRQKSLCLGVAFAACLGASAVGAEESGASAADSSAAAAGAAADSPAALRQPTPGVATTDSIPRARMRVRHTQVAVLRSGPGLEHALVTTVLEDDIVIVDARTGEWFHATGPDGTSGWVHESLLTNDVDRDRFRFTPDPGKRERQGTMLLAVYAGSYAADREDNAFLFGGRFGYALSSRFTFEVGVGKTRVVRSTYVIEQLYGLRLEEETFDVFFYETGMAIDVLPRRRVTPFLGGGVGATILNARVEPTWYLAVGTRAWLTRQLSLRWEVRDHRLEVGNQFTRFNGDNLEFSLGTELLF